MADSVGHVWYRKKRERERDLKVEKLQIYCHDPKQRNKKEKHYILWDIQKVMLRDGPMKNTWKNN